MRTGRRDFLSREEASSGHQRRLEIDFTSIALAVLSQRVPIFFFADDSHLWQFLALTFAGWVNRSQQDAIEYLKEENRVLQEQLGARRLRFTDDQRRRLAAKAKALCRENLQEIADLVTTTRLSRPYNTSVGSSN